MRLFTASLRATVNSRTAVRAGRPNEWPHKTRCRNRIRVYSVEVAASRIHGDLLEHRADRSWQIASEQHPPRTVGDRDISSGRWPDIFPRKRKNLPTKSNDINFTARVRVRDSLRLSSGVYGKSGIFFLCGKKCPTPGPSRNE